VTHRLKRRVRRLEGPDPKRRSPGLVVVLPGETREDALKRYPGAEDNPDNLYLKLTADPEPDGPK